MLSPNTDRPACRTRVKQVKASLTPSSGENHPSKTTWMCGHASPQHDGARSPISSRVMGVWSLISYSLLRMFELSSMDARDLCERETYFALQGSVLARSCAVLRDRLMLLCLARTGCSGYSKRSWLARSLACACDFMAPSRFTQTENVDQKCTWLSKSPCQLAQLSTCCSSGHNTSSSNVTDFESANSGPKASFNLNPCPCLS
jgi:hypothetical protein